MRTVALLLILASLSGCATTMDTRSRLAWGVGLGGVSGAVGGAALSPNDESRGLNALVFGLVGALAGGIIGLFSGGPSHADKGVPNLESRDRSTANPGKDYAVPIDPNLPAFVRERFRPAIIEEYVEQGTVSEDGSLSEPHKVYRIKRPAVLIAKPNSDGEKQ